jgi:hypothetical protein
MSEAGVAGSSRIAHESRHEATFGVVGVAGHVRPYVDARACRDASTFAPVSDETPPSFAAVRSDETSDGSNVYEISTSGSRGMKRSSEATWPR